MTFFLNTPLKIHFDCYMELVKACLKCEVNFKIKVRRIHRLYDFPIIPPGDVPNTVKWNLRGLHWTRDKNVTNSTSVSRTRTLKPNFQNLELRCFLFPLWVKMHFNRRKSHDFPIITQVIAYGDVSNKTKYSVVEFMWTQWNTWCKCYQIILVSHEFADKQKILRRN